MKDFLRAVNFFIREFMKMTLHFYTVGICLKQKVVEIEM
jgi:hypothetical protein